MGIPTAILDPKPTFAAISHVVETPIWENPLPFMVV